MFSSIEPTPTHCFPIQPCVALQSIPSLQSFTQPFVQNSIVHQMCQPTCLGDYQPSIWEYDQ
jgi:hypothetical protein